MEKGKRERREKKRKEKLRCTPLAESGHVRAATTLLLAQHGGHVIDHNEKGTPPPLP